MNHHTILGVILMAAVCTSCSANTDEPEAFATDPATEDVGQSLASLGESTCATATPSTTSNVTASLTIAAAQEDNSACRWAYVHQVNNVAAGTYFFNRYNGPVPLNDVNCESISVRMDVYKLTNGGWVLDVSRFSFGHWGVLGNPNVCGIPQVLRQVQSAGTYKLVLNGSYSALSYQYRSDIKVTSALARL